MIIQDLDIWQFILRNFKELYTIIHDFCLVLRNLYTIYTLDLTNNYICLVVRKFYSRFMFYLVLRNCRPSFTIALRIH